MSTALRTYYRGDELVGLRDGLSNTTRYYHFDHQGTTQCLTDSTGAVTDRFASDAWGVQVKRTGSGINRQWYVGALGYYHNEQSIAYVRARYLLPLIARWLSTDPITIPYSTPYTYVRNQPLQLVDGSGSIGEVWGNNCPKPCNHDDFGNPVSPPPALSCDKVRQLITRTYDICDADYNGNAQPDWGLDQAQTTCCSFNVCRPRCRDDERDYGRWGTGRKCKFYTGCIELHRKQGGKRDNWDWLPPVYQWCLWEHERRRVAICKCNQTDYGAQSGGITGSEKDRFLKCVGDILHKCGVQQNNCRPRVTPVPDFAPIPPDCKW